MYTNDTASGSKPGQFDTDYQINIDNFQINTNNIITKLNCTFNCQTDTNTTTSTYYNLTNGSFDYNQ